MEQLTQAQAIAFAENGLWEPLSLEDRAAFQLQQQFLCMPFEKFHEAVEQLLGRPVWTHEFAYSDRLLEEARERKPKATFEEIIALIPAEKRVIFVNTEQPTQE